MPLGLTREKLLAGLARRTGTHRYTLWRWGVAIVFTAAIAALPLSGMLRFDLWRGRHLVGGEELGVVEAAKAFAFPFLAANVLIIIATRLVGRYLCGFVCPVGTLARIAEWTRRKGGSRLLPTVGLFVFCALLATITLAFWVDLAIFVEGSVAAVSVAGGFVVVTTLVLFFGARAVGLRFCRDWCPSGVYFAILGPESKTGIEFDQEHCTECKACDSICPVDLEPRNILEGERNDSRGLYPEGMTNLALCIRCGDCVRICEGVNARQEIVPALRMGLVPETAGAGHEDEHDTPASAEQTSEPTSEPLDDTAPDERKRA